MTDSLTKEDISIVDDPNLKSRIQVNCHGITNSEALKIHNQILQDQKKAKKWDEEVHYRLLNLRFQVRDAITKIIVNCSECGNNDHVFILPDGDWSVQSLIDNMTEFSTKSNTNSKFNQLKLEYDAVCRANQDLSAKVYFQKDDIEKFNQLMESLENKVSELDNELRKIENTYEGKQQRGSSYHFEILEKKNELQKLLSEVKP